MTENYRNLRCKHDVFFKKGSEIYLATTIGFLPEKIELFYHWPWTDRTIARSYKIESVADEYLPDHLSFHNDGAAHLTTKDNKKKKIHNHLLKTKTNIFNVGRNNFLPIFVESFNLNSIRAINLRLKKVSEVNPQQHIVDITNLNSFSIILVVKCERTNPYLLLQDHGFEKLTYIQPFVIIEDLFTAQEKQTIFTTSSGFNTQLMILLVNNVWDESVQNKHLDSLGLNIFNNEENKDRLKWITMPPMEKIARMPIVS